MSRRNIPLPMGLRTMLAVRPHISSRYCRRLFRLEYRRIYAATQSFNRGVISFEGYWRRVNWRTPGVPMFITPAHPRYTEHLCISRTALNDGYKRYGDHKMAKRFQSIQIRRWENMKQAMVQDMERQEKYRKLAYQRIAKRMGWEL